MLKHISINELQPGMYVNQVVEQSGMLRIRSKGLVKTQRVIDQLREKGILVLEIDTSKGKSVEPVIPKATVTEVAKVSQSDSLNSANELYQQAVSIQGQFIKALKSGAARDLKPVNELAESIIESVFDNKDALPFLTLIKNADEYLLEHSINCCVLMGMFAEHMGYDRNVIEDVCTGVLLMDVGMSSLPEEIRDHSGSFTRADFDVMKTHVELGIEMVEQCGNIPELVLTIIEQHHERIDGSGYPRGLEGDDISDFARMAAIVDTYDAMISHRRHQEALTPTVALKRLTRQEALDQTLVKHFIQCVGVHPVGSLVRLKSGKLGIVSQRNPNDLLSPVVMTFYSTTGNHYSEIKRLDLSKSEDEIVTGVRPDDFGLNLPKFFRDVFIHQMPG